MEMRKLLLTKLPLFLAFHLNFCYSVVTCHAWNVRYYSTNHINLDILKRSYFRGLKHSKATRLRSTKIAKIPK